MDISDLFFKKALLDDPWTTLTTSLGALALTWIAFWILCCVIGYRTYFVPLVFPEDPDIAYLVGHLFALVMTIGVGYFLFRHYFGLAIFALGGVLPLLGIVLKILRVLALRRRDEAAMPAATTAGN